MQVKYVIKNVIIRKGNGELLKRHGTHTFFVFAEKGQQNS